MAMFCEQVPYRLGKSCLSFTPMTMTHHTTGFLPAQLRFYGRDIQVYCMPPRDVMAANVSETNEGYAICFPDSATLLMFCVKHEIEIERVYLFFYSWQTVYSVNVVRGRRRFSATQV